MVLVHARALLTSRPQGATEYIDADLHEAVSTLDFTQPSALMLNGIIGHIEDDDEARACVRRLVAALPPGSYLAMSDGTDTDQRACAPRTCITTAARSRTTCAARPFS